MNFKTLKRICLFLFCMWRVLLLLLLFVLPKYMNVFHLCARYSWKPRDCRIACHWKYKALWVFMWVLGTCLSSWPEQWEFNHKAISEAPDCNMRKLAMKCMWAVLVVFITIFVLYMCICVYIVYMCIYLCICIAHM